jgi:hypothetical protein
MNSKQRYALPAIETLKFIGTDQSPERFDVDIYLDPVNDRITYHVNPDTRTYIVFKDGEEVEENDF